MTFDEQVNRITPTEGKCLIEPWVSGGTLDNGITFSHSSDLPTVYAFVWRLPPDYAGPVCLGDMVMHPRYAYETIAEGNDDATPWKLAIMNLEDIECIIPLEELLCPD